MVYKTALICLNGHIVNGNIDDYPEDNKKYCSHCGLETMSSCKNCGESLLGDNDYSVGYEVLQIIPKHCHNCGKSYPWTEQKITAAKMLAEELDGLSDEEIDNLKKSIDDLIQDGPMTTVAQTRFKKLINKSGSEVANGFRDILIGIVSETVKKTLWPTL